jgi:hypothetical protein
MTGKWVKVLDVKTSWKAKVQITISGKILTTGYQDGCGGEPEVLKIKEIPKTDSITVCSDCL